MVINISIHTRCTHKKVMLTFGGFSCFFEGCFLDDCFLPKFSVPSKNAFYNRGAFKNCSLTKCISEQLSLKYTFFCNILFFKINCNRKTYFINYNLQTKWKKIFYHPLSCPSGYWKPTLFAYCPVLTLPLFHQLKDWIRENVKNFLVLNKFSTMFLTFVISQIKDLFLMI